MKKYIKYVIALILVGGLLLFSFNRIPVLKIKGDSGFDSSYDSGGSWDSGSSGDSGYSSGSDIGNNSTKTVLSSDDPMVYLVFSTIIFLGFPILLIVAIIISNKSKKKFLVNKVEYNMLNYKKELDENIIKEKYPEYNKNTFVIERYLDYIKIQTAWMNFDYETLREKLTDELYNQYEMQLETLKLKNEKNVMRDFIYKEGIVTNITNENNLITITIELVVKFIDYIENNGTIIKGDSEKPICMHYEIKFVCNLEDKIDKCPNCGADIGDSASKKCGSCGSIISNISSNWVMSKKEAKGQR